MLARLVSAAVVIGSVLLAGAANYTSLFLGGVLSMIGIIGCLAVGGLANRSNRFVVEDVCKILWCLSIMTLIVIVGFSLVEWSVALVEMMGENLAILVVLVVGVLGFMLWCVYAQHSDRYIRDLFFDMGRLH